MGDKLRMEIRESGAFTTIQDAGRPGFRGLGVPFGGAADREALFCANAFLGQSEHCAALEYAGGIFAARILTDGVICLAGHAVLKIDGEEVFGVRPLAVQAGQLLEIRPSRKGNFACLAVPGGWAVPDILGSKSTCVAAGFGGYEGRILEKGDLLENTGLALNPSIPSKVYYPYPEPRRTMRVIPGPEIGYWTEAQRYWLVESDFQVAPDRNRMGVRLTGPAITAFAAKEMLSVPVAPGAVQVPPDGHPLVLSVDAQTTGGYPRIAQVIAADLDDFVQLPTGAFFRFAWTTPEDARRQWDAQACRRNIIRFALSEPPFR